MAKSRRHTQDRFQSAEIVRLVVIAGKEVAAFLGCVAKNGCLVSMVVEGSLRKWAILNDGLHANAGCKMATRSKWCIEILVTLRHH